MQKQDKDNNFLECYQETLNQMADTFYLKNERYGDSFTQTMDDYGLVTSIIRITDKFNRLTTLYKNKNLDVDDEPIIDTMLDMANYLAMTVAYIKSRKATTDYQDNISQNNKWTNIVADTKTNKVDNLRINV